MKIKFNILLLALFSMLIVACEDDEGPFNGPYRLIIAGPHSAAPGDVEEFTIGDIDNPESYTWTAEGPANIVGSATGNTIEVEFTGVGDVTLSVSNGPDNGMLNVDVEEVEPNFTTSLNEFGALRRDATDTVFFTFDSPLAETPSIALYNDSTGFNQGEPFVSGSISDLFQDEDDDNVYYALYTAGEGEGIPEVVLRNIRGTEMFGGVEIDSAFAQLYRVDNTAPVSSLSYSETLVNDSTVVTITATFSEEVRPAQDSAMFITFSGGGVEQETDTLEPTANPLVYTYQYTVNGGGNGTVNVDLQNVADFAGNELAAVDNSSELRVDNSRPTILGTARDAGNSVTISLFSSERGTGWYTVLANNADAPESVDDFSGGIKDGTFNFEEGGTTRTVSVALPSGQYDVYFIARDRAGNFSNIQKSDLLVD